MQPVKLNKTLCLNFNSPLNQHIFLISINETLKTEVLRFPVNVQICLNL